MLGMPHIKELIYENRKTYAEKHGVEFMWANMTSYNLSNGAPIYWNKISLLEEAFVRHPDAEWVWWMDMDIIYDTQHLRPYPVAGRIGVHILLDHELNGAGGDTTGFSTPASYKHDDINFIISQDSWGVKMGVS